MTTDTTRSFDLPKDFIFGVATAAYQIEGAATEDGRGPSIWDTFSHTKGNVVNNDNGDVACDHYHRLDSDLDLIKSLQVHAYRFSFAWSRIMPTGFGAVNNKGLDFYDRLIDGCLDRNLQPFATLYHWDLPQALQDSGGWINRETALRFADYAALVTERYGDRLSSISTFNEPWCSSMLGHLFGIHAPGDKDISLAIKAVHNQHLAHGLAVQNIKANKPDLKAGIVLNLQSVYPATDTTLDVDAAIRHEQFHNGLFLDPLFKGQYPKQCIEALGEHFPKDWEDDLNTIHQPLDFWGLNYYTPARVSHDATESAHFPKSTTEPPKPDVPITDIGWEIDAQTFYDVLAKSYEQYTLPPCYITENGACFNEGIVGGTVTDNTRLAYINEHIQAVEKAVRDQVPVIGYFAWSLMDNFEWAEGYTMRFGLVHVDYETQVRTVKASGHWYADKVSTHRGKQ